MPNTHTKTSTRTNGNANTLVLVDIENMVGDPGASEEEYRTVFTFLRQFAITLCPQTRTIMASSHYAAASAWFAAEGSPVQRLMRSGPNGADLALLEAAPTAEIAARYQQVILCSGDHIFTPYVEELRALGVAVTLVIGRGKPARTLLAACPSRIWLHLPNATEGHHNPEGNTLTLAA